MLTISGAEARENNALWRAVCIVESGNTPRAIGDQGRAVGIAQLWPIMVAECNRLAGRTRWTLADRYSPAKSRQMFDFYMRQFRGKSAEFKARAWNGGPHGPKNPATKKYWSKIQKKLR